MVFVPSALYLAAVIKKAVNCDALFPMVKRYVPVAHRYISLFCFLLSNSPVKALKGGYSQYPQKLPITKLFSSFFA